MTTLPKQPKLTPEQRMLALMQAEPAILSQCDQILTGQEKPQPSRLLNFREAAGALNVSRSTIHRMVSEGILDTVELRKGRRRIREADLLNLIER